jgi:glycerol-3-phosphate acyltransferase PlsY
MLELGIKTLLAYFIGAIIGSLVIGRFRKVDIRTMGSGNAGGTNALRTQGKAFGIVVLLIDILKGVIAVAVLPTLDIPGVGIDPHVGREWLQMCCAGAVIVGHVYPLWFDFRGGKGVATVLGVVATLHPWALVPLLCAWVLVLVLTGFVGLASMLAGLVLILSVWLRTPDDLPFLLFSILTAAFIIYTHRGNLQRMLAGTENRARKVWLLRPRSP